MRNFTHSINRLSFGVFLLLVPFLAFAQPQTTGEYETLDIDYCKTDGSVHYNFYWPDGHLSGSPFFGSAQGATLSFTEYADGTALIEGTTVQGTCTAEGYIVLTGLSTWDEWTAAGGTYKQMGCSDPDPTQMRYYQIDNSRSTITVSGGDCLETGTGGWVSPR